jgi:Na+-driven multidrug efflux pump
VIGNTLGILTCFWHCFRKENTLRFVWHLSFRDFLLTSRYSIVDSSVYICWGLMDYVMIGFVSGRFGEIGLIALAVVVSLIEFGVVMDGVGMAMQPLIGTYFGERNHQLIKRVMRSAVKAAVIEGLAATALIWAFTRQFCALFGITGGEALTPSISALRIVSLGFTFCSAVSLTTSYYMLIDHIGMAACITSEPLISDERPVNESSTSVSAGASSALPTMPSTTPRLSLSERHPAALTA